MHLKDFENSPPSLIAQRSSMNWLVIWYLYALVYFLEIIEIIFCICIDSKKKKKKKNRETDLPRKEQGQYP